MNTNTTNTTNTDIIPIGSVVRLQSDDCKTRALGVVKAIRAGSLAFPGWNYDVAWTGRVGLDRSVPAYLITPIWLGVEGGPCFVNGVPVHAFR